MSGSLDEAVQLAKRASRLLKNNEVYLEYIQAKEAVEKDPELFERIKTFKKADYEYRQMLLRGEENFDIEKGLSQEYYKLLLNEEANKFLTSEKKLVEGLGTVYNELFNDEYPDILL